MDNIGNSTEYLYGKLNKEILYFEYKGSTTNTSTTSITQDTAEGEDNRVISVDVIRVPNRLSFKENENKISYFDGSFPLNIDLSKYSLDVSNLSRVELVGNVMSFYNKEDVLITSLDISGFIQEQSNLAETDSTKETYVKNKSTKYLVNEGDGTLNNGEVDPYIKASQLNSITEELQASIAQEVLDRTEIDNTLQESINDINSKIPEDTSSTNKLINSVQFNPIETLINNHIKDLYNPHQVTKSQIGLGNVDNTSDLDKPISTLQQNENIRLQNSINTEATTRENADNVLQSNIDNINNILTTDIQPNISNLKNTVTTNVESVNTLNSKINIDVVTDAGFTYNSETGKSYITQTKTNISSNNTEINGTEVPIATSTQPGLMSIAQVDTLSKTLQKGDITTGTTNGSISVKDTDVPVKGLTETAYTDKSFFAEDSKVLHKDGDQLINGSLSISKDATISGNLTVQGTTTTTNTETLAVQDNLIVTNSGGVSLPGNSGLAIKTGNNNEAYAIVYDPISTVGGSVKLGLGTIDGNNEFTFSDGDGEPIATRADSNDPTMVDKTLMQWDSTNHKLIGSGLTANDITTNLDDLSTELTTANKKILANSNLISINTSNIDNISIKIPPSASSTNQLATENYVQQNGGKIDAIQVNGTTQTITNKVVNITVPTSTSNLTNDSDFIDGSTLTTTLNNYALNNSVVKLTGNQSITGVKTFNNNPIIQSIGASITLKDNNVSNDTSVTLHSPLLGEGTSAVKNIYLPNKDGTVALLSDIPTHENYVDLGSNQTITGVKAFANNGGVPSTIINPTVADESLRGTYTQRLVISTNPSDVTIKPNIALTSGGITFNPTTSGAGTLLKAQATTTLNTLNLPTTSGTLALTSQIPSLTNYVTTNTSQTISGVKTFSSNPKLTAAATNTRQNYIIEAASDGTLYKRAIENIVDDIGASTTLSIVSLSPATTVSTRSDDYAYMILPGTISNSIAAVAAYLYNNGYTSSTNVYPLISNPAYQNNTTEISIMDYIGCYASNATSLTASIRTKSTQGVIINSTNYSLFTNDVGSKSTLNMKLNSVKTIE